MKRFIKSFLLYVLTISLCASVFSIAATADDPDPTVQTAGRKLYIDYLGQGDAPAATKQPDANFDADDAGKLFWVGVAVDNVDDLELFTKGVYSLEVAFEYDPDFVKPFGEPEQSGEDWNQNFTARLEEANLTSSSAAADENALRWLAGEYNIISYARTELDTVNDRENKDAAVARADTWCMCTVCVTLKDNANTANARFKDLATGDKQYLVRLPFVLQRAPREGEDPNPTVLSFVRGPETFDIGSASDGVTTYSAWEATITADNNNPTNLKTLFTFNGDVSLFGSAGSVADIIPFKEKSGDETDDTVYTLYRNKPLSESGFDHSVKDYYVEVPNAASKLRLKIETPDEPTVKFGSANLTVTQSSAHYITEEFDLTAMTAAPDEDNDGFDTNRVTVQSGDMVYTIHIRRLPSAAAGEAKIVLNPGNSPYGMIMKAFSGTKVTIDGVERDKAEVAKEEFDKQDCFAEGYVPAEAENMYLNKGVRILYSPETWGDAPNIDKDDTAIFVYNGKTFRDPGFVATDSAGNTVPDADITRTIKVNRMLSLGLDDLSNVTDPDGADAVATKSLLTYTGGDNNMLYTDITVDDINQFIRPGVYHMEYKFTDPVTANEITATRNVVVLCLTGDTDLSGDYSGIDPNAVLSAIAKRKVIVNNASDEFIRLYTYRILDTDGSGDISGIDPNAILTAIAKKQTVAQYYNALPSE